MGQTRWSQLIEDKECRSDDGLKLFYQTIGKGEKVIVLANGLGGRLYSWAPFLDRYCESHKLISWDYRGLFDSDSPSQKFDLSIHRHADDLRAILKKEQVESAIFAGWSMGVQVVLEFCVRNRRMVEKLILINGTHGHAMETGLQPFFRVPKIAKYLHEVIEATDRSQKVTDAICYLPQKEWIKNSLGKVFRLLWRNKDLELFADWFFSDVFNRKNFPNIMKLMQELDAHSIYHHLREIDHPCLVISGGMDFLTPSYQSREMVRKLKNAKHVHYPLAGHLIILEKSISLIKHVDRFLQQ